MDMPAVLTFSLTHPSHSTRGCPLTSPWLFVDSVKTETARPWQLNENVSLLSIDHRLTVTIYY